MSRIRYNQRAYAIQYHLRDDKKVVGFELYLAKTAKSARRMFKEDFGKSRIIEWIKRRA
jgi:hypothetical protein